MFMDLKNLFKKEYLIGLDIGSSSVKMVQFKKEEDGGLSLVRADMKELKYSLAEEEKTKELLSALNHIFKGIDTKRSHVMAITNCPHSVIKKITAPYMPKAELREGIMLESKNYFPFPTDRSVLDFEVLGDAVEKGVRKYEILVGTCPLGTVNNTLSILQKAGIKPASLVSSSYALHEFAVAASKHGTMERCLVDIGETHTELIIYKGGTIQFTRKIPVSGRSFTEAMMGVLVSDKGRVQLSREEAEKIKQEVGMPSDSDSRLIDGKISAQQVLAMVRSPAEYLVSEIERCFDYYREGLVGGKIDSVTIFGGGASLSGLASFLSAGLGMEVRIGDALEGLKMEPGAVRERERISHRLEFAIGSALGGSKGLNFLPAEMKEETRRTIRRGTIEAIFAAIVIVSVLAYIGMNIKLDNFDKRSSAARMEAASLSEEIKKAEAKILAQTVLSDEPYWEDVFHELGSLIPDEVLIEDLRVENKVITIKGVVESPDGQQVLADFIISLESGLFNGVRLIESKNLPDRPGVEFEVSLWIDYER